MLEPRFRLVEPSLNDERNTVDCVGDPGDGIVRPAVALSEFDRLLAALGAPRYRIEDRDLCQMGDSAELYLMAWGVKQPSCTAGKTRIAYGTLDVEPRSILYKFVANGDTNRIKLTVTDSTLKLTTRQSPYITADEHVVRRPAGHRQKN